MKDELYAVEYSITTLYESLVKASSRIEARDKVVEVIGKPLKVHRVIRLKPKNLNDE